jgi:hypothetical protein
MTIEAQSEASGDTWVSIMVACRGPVMLMSSFRGS